MQTSHEYAADEREGQKLQPQMHSPKDSLVSVCLTEAEADTAAILRAIEYAYAFAA